MVLARYDKKTYITPRHIYLTIYNDEELTKSKKLQEAMKKRREDDFKSQLAFLHHEDFLNQLGQEAIPKIDNTIKVTRKIIKTKKRKNHQNLSPWKKVGPGPLNLKKGWIPQP